MALTSEQTRKVQDLLAKEPRIISIVQDIQTAGGIVYLVGGAVRDILLGDIPHDLDLEVHSLTLQELHGILAKQGTVIEAGKSFGVLRLEHSNAEWALPRTDSAGRKPQVQIDASLTIEQALERRDVTINAMAIELGSFTLVDPFNGLHDLQKRILRSPNTQKFIEDPLRFYRVMQFIGRFDATVDPALEEVCKTMDITTIARERIEVEFEKLFLKSRSPSRALRWIAHIKRVHEILPELAATRGIIQSPQWHPEGDVFEHTMQALDAAAHGQYKNSTEKLTLMYAALCHDLGKVTTTTQDADGRIKSYGHEIAGVPFARALLKRITENNDLLKAVSVLVRYHMMPGSFVKQHASGAAYKRLAHKIYPLTLRELSLLAYADRRGRNGSAHTPLTGPIDDIDRFVEQAQKQGVYERPEEPLIQGRDLVAVYTPGPLVGKLVNFAYSVQINRGIRDKDRLLRIIAQEAKKL